MLRLCWAFTRTRSEAAIALRSAFKVAPVSSAPGWGHFASTVGVSVSHRQHREKGRLLMSDKEPPPKPQPPEWLREEEARQIVQEYIDDQRAITN